MVKFTETKTEDLVKRIENLKAERERTVDCLSRLESELEKRKNKAPLGVPSSNRVKNYYCVTEYGHINTLYDDDDELDKCFFDIMNYFSSKESAKKHAEMLLTWRKALVANSKGEQIDIKVLCPLLPKGWVACDSSGEWFVFSCKPFIRQKVGSKDEGIWDSDQHAGFRGHLPFNIKPAEDWRKSLMECGL